MFAFQEYYKAQSVQNAVELLGQHPGTRLLAGGTDVLVKLRALDMGYARVVDIHGLQELEGIELREGGVVRIGSGVTFTQILESELLQRLPILVQAAATVAGTQIRNVATVGGNLCNGAVSADSAAPLLVLNAHLRVQGADGIRSFPLQELHTGPGKVSLGADEVLLSVDIAQQDWENLRGIYHKYAMREAMDIATIGCALCLRMDGERIADLRLAYTVAAPTPRRCPHAEAVALGQKLDAATVQAIWQALEQDLAPRSSWRAEKDFRWHIIRTLAERNLYALAHGGDNADNPL